MTRESMISQIIKNYYKIRKFIDKFDIDSEEIDFVKIDKEKNYLISLSKGRLFIAVDDSNPCILRIFDQDRDELEIEDFDEGELESIKKSLLSNYKIIFQNLLRAKDALALRNLSEFLSSLPLEIAGECVNFKYDKIGHPLFWATINRDPNLILLLLDHNVNCNNLDENGDSVLHHFFRLPAIDFKILKRVIEKTTDDIFSATNNSQGNTIFHELFMNDALTSNDKIKVILFLVEAGADADVKDRDGYNARQYINLEVDSSLDEFLENMQLQHKRLTELRKDLKEARSYPSLAPEFKGKSPLSKIDQHIKE